MTLITLLQCLLAPLPLTDSVIVDSNISFEQAIQGSTAPDSIIRTLTLVNVEYYSFDNRLHRGQIVVHRELEEDVRNLFHELRQQRFPVESVIPIRFDKPNNGTSMDTLNNTYGFHYRTKATFRTTQLSTHARGRAIDINPFHNPAHLRNGHIIPSRGHYAPGTPGTLSDTSSIVRYMRQQGWRWGGGWKSVQDYMHFEKP